MAPASHGSCMIRPKKLGLFLGAFLLVAGLIVAAAHPALADDATDLQTKAIQAEEAQKVVPEGGQLIDDPQELSNASDLNALWDSAKGEIEELTDHKGDTATTNNIVMGTLKRGVTGVANLDRSTSSSPSGASVKFNVPTAQVVMLKVSASGYTTDSDGIIGAFEVSSSNGAQQDLITMYEYRDQICNWVLPAGTYTITYVNLASGSSRVQFHYDYTDIDSSGYQVFLPGLRGLDQAPQVQLNKDIWGMFYWGYSQTSAEVDSGHRTTDGHDYRFRLTERSLVTLRLNTWGTAAIGLYDSSGHLMSGKSAMTTPVSGSTTGMYSASVNCGSLDPGTYYVTVATGTQPAFNEMFFVNIHTSLDPSVPIPQPDNGYNVYRLYNQWSGEHLYTMKEEERRGLMQQGWDYEGVAWVAPKSGSTEVYRLYNRWSKEHLYTADPNERNTRVREGWNDEGTAWFSDDAKTTPVYRLYNRWNPEISSHLYTKDVNEYNQQASRGWTKEGEVFYGVG